MVGATPEISDTELLREVYLSPDAIVTTGELADRTGYSRQAVNYRFQNLIEEGLLTSRDVGSRATVYWLTDAGERRLVSE